MSTRFLTLLALVVAVFAVPSLAFAEAMIKPVPTPDLSKLPAAKADELREIRATFDKQRAVLVGDPLAEVYALIGAAYASNGFPQAAAVALEDASLLAPKDGRWVYARGVLARSQQQNAVAQNFFEIALQLDQDYLPIRLAVARSKLDNGDTAGARALLVGYVAKHADQAPAHALLGEIALREKRYSEAVGHLQRALALEPQATALYSTLAQAQTGAGNTAAAAEARAKAGNVAPVVADPIAAGLLGKAAPAPAQASASPVAKQVNEAAAYLQLRQYDAARRQLDAALKLRPNDAALLALYARVEAAAGDLGAARSRASAAIAADGTSALAHMSQGVALEMGKDDAGARRAYEQAVRLDPKLAEARTMLGSLLMRTGRNEEAIAQYRALVQLDARNRESWMHLVAAYVVAGRCAAALRDTSDLLATDPANAFVLQLFVRLASTCPAASANERRGALEHGGRLYAQAATAPISEAYALALAANGRWDDAVKTQEAAMFVLVRNGLKGALTGYREVLDQLKAHTLPARPWPASAAVFHPTRLTPDPKPPARKP